MKRVDFLKLSIVSLAGLSVTDLTDRHDEWLHDRELESPPRADGVMLVIAYGTVGGKEDVELGSTIVGYVARDGALWPLIESPAFVVTATEQLVVTDLVGEVDFGEWIPIKIKTHFSNPMLPLTLYPTETCTVVFDQALARLT